MTTADMVERRFTPGKLEARQDPESKAGIINGYAAVFNKLSQNLGGFVEEIAPVSFNQARSAGWQGVICRFNHDDMALLGSTASGSLQLHIDEYGLRYDVQPPKARADIVELVERGDITKSSFAFRVVDEDWGTTEQGYPRRRLLEAELIDVAPVISPAYLDTSASLRSLAAKVGADYEEVRKASEANDLLKFFVRTDNKGKKPVKKKVFGPQARMLLEARRHDPMYGDKK